MDRYWFLTWTTYGTWLPGDKRGFVGPVDDQLGGWESHNAPGTPYDEGVAELRNYAEHLMKGQPILLTSEQAKAIAEQLHGTAEKRGWELIAFAVMPNHVHLIVAVKGDPDPSHLLRDFKSYSSGSLNRLWNKPQSETWWTESGSKRKLPNEPSLLGAVRYVARQSNPHIVWIAEKYRDLISPGERGA